MDAETKEVRTRIFAAFYGNIIVAIMIICIVLTFNDGSSPYLRFGWNDNLSVLGVKIDTGAKYFCLSCVLGIFEFFEVFINDTIFPYINNNVRDNNVKEIKEFTKTETRVVTNGTFFITDIKYSIYIMVSISQIDIVLIKVAIGFVASVLTTDTQLIGKSFLNDEYVAVPVIELAAKDMV